jgi:putative peptidoglycan lipid II flippase
MSENRRIARAAGLVGAVTLVSRITGLLRDVVTGYYFGAGSAADAFFVAFRLPNLLRRFVGEGAMSVAFIPIFAEYLRHDSAVHAERALRALAGGLAVVGGVLTLIGIVLAPLWVELLAPGFGAEPETRALTVELTRLIFPYVLLVSEVALFGGFLNALRHFVAPAFAPVLLNLAMIGCAIVLVPSLERPILALVIGVLLGGVLQLAAQIVPLMARGVSVTPVWQPSHPALGRVLRLLGPSTFGVAAYQINVMISTSLASVLPVGSVAALWYAGRIVEFPIGVVAAAIGTAALPSFAEQAVRGAHAELRRSLGFALALSTTVAVPASLSLLVLARPITAVLLQHGAFGPADVERTAVALQAYAVGLWPLAVVRVIVPAFYALRDVRTPVRASVAALLANIAGSLVLIGPVPLHQSSWLAAAIARGAAAFHLVDFSHAGLALAASFATVVNAVCLIPPLGRRLGGFDVKPTVAALARSLVASIPMVAITYVAATLVDWTAPGQSMSKALWLAAIVAAGGATFGIAAFVLGGPEVARLRKVLE